MEVEMENGLVLVLFRQFLADVLVSDCTIQS